MLGFYRLDKNFQSFPYNFLMASLGFFDESSPILSFRVGNAPWPAIIEIRKPKFETRKSEFAAGADMSFHVGTLPTRP
jgi:hypothetical protein